MMDHFMFKIMIILMLFLVLIHITLVDSKPINIKTDIGIIKGKSEDIHVFGQTLSVTKFLGIPYAEPPVGDLRFKKPIPKTALKTPLDALWYGNACLQVDIGRQPESNITFSEDCLYLNIYVPEKQSVDVNLAVMVWFHGGAFVFGSSDIYPADNLATYGQVIVVTVNYRLTLWGFLSTGDEHALGNYGLWDQHLALTWIHENIAAFGGDPNRVTIFGESAGAASVVFQGLYQKNKGLFQRIIAQSGSAGSWWASNDNPLQNTQTLSIYAGCETKSTANMVACLKSIPGEKLLEIVNKWENGFKTVPVPFIPNFDNDFVTFPTTKTFVDGYNLPVESQEFYMSLDVLAGMNCGEGSLTFNPLFGVADANNFLPDRTDFLENIVPAVQKLIYPECDSKVIRDMIVAEYTNWEIPDDKILIREEYLAMHADFIFTDPLYRMLDHHITPEGKTYMYYFKEKTSNHLFCNISWFDKLGHGDEIPFIFGFKNAEHVKGWKVFAKKWEEQLSKNVIKLWSNFAKTGNPNFPDDLGIDWLPYTKKHKHYLQISRDMTSASVKQRWNVKRANFWTNLLPKLVESVTCNQQTSCIKASASNAKCSP